MEGNGCVLNWGIIAGSD